MYLYVSFLKNIVVSPFYDMYVHMYAQRELQKAPSELNIYSHFSPGVDLVNKFRSLFTDETKWKLNIIK
jgi:hypothetical protein